MSKLDLTPEQEAAMAAARAKLERLQLAYQRVFAGKGKKDDALLVVADLETTCGARRSLHGPVSSDTEYSVGKFTVWQRINNMRFPRPADAEAWLWPTKVNREGGLHGEEQEGERPEAGRGVSHVTQD